MIKVIIVDDHALFRLGVSTSISNSRREIQVVGEAESGEDLFDLLRTTAADLVLLDIMLPGMSGIETARRLRSEHPKIKILAVSSENTAAVLESLLEIGIDGFISKRYGGIGEIAQAIQTVMSGIEYFGKDIAAIIYQIYVSKKSAAGVTPEFTEREREIIELCRDGLIGKEIGERLGISIHTVNNHKNNIFRKLGIENTMEMVQYALKHKIIRPE